MNFNCNTERLDQALACYSNGFLARVAAFFDTYTATNQHAPLCGWLRYDCYEKGPVYMLIQNLRDHCTVEGDEPRWPYIEANREACPPRWAQEIRRYLAAQETL